MAEKQPTSPADWDGQKTAYGQSVLRTEAVDRAHAAHGGRWRSGAIQDWVCRGTVTHFSLEGRPSTFDVTLMRKGRGQVQQVMTQPGGTVRHGSDGTTSWQAFGLGSPGGFSAPAQGKQLHAIEAHTLRSHPVLFNHQTEGLTLTDLGAGNQDLGAGQGPARVIEAQDGGGRKTRYFIDNATSLVTRLEFDVGQIRQAFPNRVIPETDTYVFSDFRNVNGVQTPFKVERFTARVKTEEWQFTSVQYNVGIRDTTFRP